ncbi:hypothetical protein HPP92_008611 [Vanilla planifolia]|uniref:Uncharacterized protein n=1 Tax=Vanilla planifolia TaxID=51239 RepID=A0A835RE19_VANPL|nr:hypothetical protein HPP92_008611 [Vanilla planifolia]
MMSGRRCKVSAAIGATAAGRSVGRLQKPGSQVGKQRKEEARLSLGMWRIDPVAVSRKEADGWRYGIGDWLTAR